jgi:two-component system, chemotaxis family, chemotaxis protein CheY
MSDDFMPSNVLVVDDSPTMRRMVVSSLRTVNSIQASEAGSGLEAIEQLAVKPISLMVLDLNMPDMHGMEVIDFVRRHRAYKDIPIVVLTTKGEEASRAKAMAAGANQYLTKPFDPNNLAAIVASLLEEARANI